MERKIMGEDLVEALKLIAAGKCMAVDLLEDPTLARRQYKTLQDFVEAAENVLHKYPNMKGL